MAQRKNLEARLKDDFSKCLLRIHPEIIPKEAFSDQL